jgi:outer membrane lipopolysaccharide assembly protein LptE/RlpB
MRTWLVLLSLLVLSACGFHLRGSQSGGTYLLAFDSLYISLPETAEFRVQLKRTIESSSKTRVVDKAQDAQATLQVLGDNQAKNILSMVKTATNWRHRARSSSGGTSPLATPPCFPRKPRRPCCGAKCRMT